MLEIEIYFRAFDKGKFKKDYKLTDIEYNIEKIILVYQFDENGK